MTIQYIYSNLKNYFFRKTYLVFGIYDASGFYGFLDLKKNNLNVNLLVDTGSRPATELSATRSLPTDKIP